MKIHIRAYWNSQLTIGFVFRLKMICTVICFNTEERYEGQFTFQHEGHLWTVKVNVYVMFVAVTHGI